MSVRVSCPFCTTAFDLPAVPPARRTTCPRCGESVPVSADATPLSADAVPQPVPAPKRQPMRNGNLLIASLLFIFFAIIGFSWWKDLRPWKPTAPTDSSKPALPPATKPPVMLPALKYLPRDTQLVVAVQPSPLVQYAERTGQEPKAVFAALGLPKQLFDGLTDAGFPPTAIDHVVLGASAADLWLMAVLVLREPFDEDRVRQKLKAKVNPDKPGRWRAELGGVGWDVQQADERTLLFALVKEANLDTAKKPTAGLADLRPGLKESVERLSPASFAWVATDSTDWATVKGLELAAGFAKQPDLPKKLAGLRAVVAGLSFEPEMRLSVAVRADEVKVNELAIAMTERLKDAKAEVKTSKEWVDATIPFDPPADALAVLRKAIQ